MLWTFENTWPHPDKGLLTNLQKYQAKKLDWSETLQRNIFLVSGLLAKFCADGRPKSEASSGNLPNKFEQIC